MASYDSDSSGGSSSDIGCSGDSDKGYQGHSIPGGYSDSSPDYSSSEADKPNRKNMIPGTLKTIAGLGLIGLCTFGGAKSGNYLETQLQIRDPSRAAHVCDSAPPIAGGLGGLLLSSTVIFLYLMNKNR